MQSTPMPFALSVDPEAVPLQCVMLHESGMSGPLRHACWDDGAQAELYMAEHTAHNRCYLSGSACKCISSCPAGPNTRLRFLGSCRMSSSLLNPSPS
jgi:hypothetical protein